MRVNFLPFTWKQRCFISNNSAIKSYFQAKGCTEISSLSYWLTSFASALFNFFHVVGSPVAHFAVVESPLKQQQQREQPDDNEFNSGRQQMDKCFHKFIASNLLASSADSAIKNPWVVESIKTSGPGLIAKQLSLPPSPLLSIAISNSFSFVKHNLLRWGNDLRLFISITSRSTQTCSNNFNVYSLGIVWVLQQLFWEKIMTIFQLQQFKCLSLLNNFHNDAFWEKFTLTRRCIINNYLK